MNIMKKNKPNISVLIVAGGTGQRFGQKSIPKQYQTIFGKTVIERSIEPFLRHPVVSAVSVVINPEHSIYLEQLTCLQNNSIHIIHGGSTRQESVRLGLEKLQSVASDRPDYVLIHDAARPLTSHDLVSSICAKLLEGEPAVIPGLAITDTIKRTFEGDSKIKTEDRQSLYTIQTPQAFDFETIYNLHQKFKNKNFTDDAALLEEENIPVKIIPGDKKNIKLTYPEDVSLIKTLIAQECADIRTGQGYDVHRFVQKTADHQKFKLCGVEIDHPYVLEGHSDADVALHAITDALLACISDGDIGFHFSPKDPRWKSADSLQFLRHAAELIKSKNGIISHVDVTIICEEPKIGPHRDVMRQKISDTLTLDIDRVSVKATTTEGLGFTGRKEGIAAQASATVRLPF